MADFNDRANRTIKKQLFFEKENIKISGRVLQVIRSLYPEVEKLLQQYYDGKITANILNADVEALITQRFSVLDESLYKEALTVIQQETTNTGRIIAAAAFAPAAAKITKETLSAIQQNVIANNKFFTVEFTKYKRLAYSRILVSVNDAVINSKTFRQAADMIGRTSKLNNNQLSTVTRTMMRSVQTDTSMVVFKRNGIKRLKFVAVLDDRTTDVCKDLDGTIFDIEDAPRLGLHYNCRSHYIAVFDDDEKADLGRKISWAEYYQKNKDDPDLKRLQYVYGGK